MSNQRIRVFIADDHKILIDSLIALLTGQNPNQLSPLDTPGNSPDQRDSGIVFVGRAESPEQLFERLGKMSHAVDVLLQDVNFTPERNAKEGIASAVRIREMYPHIKVVILSQMEDGETIAQAIQAGVHGYISKSMGKKDLLEGINQVVRGEFVVKIPRPAPIATTKMVNEEVKLTELEYKILCCTVAEMTASQIAEYLKMTQTNVDRINRILRSKLGVQNVAGLVREAMKRHLCDDWEQVSGRQLPFSS